MRLLDDVSRSTESRTDMAVMAVITTVADGTVVKALQSSVFETAVEQAVKKMMIGLYVMDQIATRTIDATAFIAPLAIFVKNEIEKCALAQAKIEKRHQKLIKVGKEVGKPSSLNKRSS